MAVASVAEMEVTAEAAAATEEPVADLAVLRTKGIAPTIHRSLRQGYLASVRNLAM